MALFAQGHSFTAEEIGGFSALKDGLAERGDADLATDIDLVRVALVAGSEASETKDLEEWNKVDAQLRNQKSWQSLRELGLVTLRLSSALAIGSAAWYNKTPSTLALGTMAGALGAMGLSLFPLLWAEPRQ